MIIITKKKQNNEHSKHIENLLFRSPNSLNEHRNMGHSDIVNKFKTGDCCINSIVMTTSNGRRIEKKNRNNIENNFSAILSFNFTTEVDTSEEEKKN